MIKVPEKSTHKLNCSNELAYFSRPFTKEVYQLVKMKMTVDISFNFSFFSDISPATGQEPAVWPFLGPIYMVSDTRDNSSPEAIILSVYMRKSCPSLLVEKLTLHIPCMIISSP